ncbi:hypothetical protein [Pseudophaeobacter sp.]
MGTRALVLGGAALTVGLGIVLMLVLDRGETSVPSSFSEFVTISEPIQFEPRQVQREFQRMAVAADEVPECALPKPPKSIGATALTRNSLQQILRILALRQWQKNGSCECFYDRLGWDDVILVAPNFERTDGVDLRFKITDLLAEADELEALRLKACPQ